MDKVRAKSGIPDILERVRGVEPLSRLWKSRVIAVIPYPQFKFVQLMLLSSPLFFYGGF